MTSSRQIWEVRKNSLQNKESYSFVIVGYPESDCSGTRFDHNLQIEDGSITGNKIVNGTELLDNEEYLSRYSKTIDEMYDWCEGFIEDYLLNQGINLSFGLSSDGLISYCKISNTTDLSSGFENMILLQ